MYAEALKNISRICPGIYLDISGLLSSKLGSTAELY
jgi:hypothetical protein